ncbi:MAG: hypothetical protein J6X34_03365 [Clostridia bacterium]|nr:hypothetical protein [Clostridia bacterium]
MSNLQRLATAENNNQRLFAETINTLRNSQGFYSRLYQTVNQLSEEGYRDLTALLDQQNFKDSVDVVLWLEA